MYFQHSAGIWADHPDLVGGVVAAAGITGRADVAATVGTFTAIAADRLAAAAVSELPEIRAWRHAFAGMGLKPTQYRCASEALLRRFAKDGELPRIHPLIDVCNAISMAYAIPVAALDADRIAGSLQVRYARGDETYLTFGGEVEHPAAGEVSFVDDNGRAHARRWTNRQSGYSAVRGSTTSVLIVAEALHDSAARDVPKLVGAVADALADGWSVTPATAILTASAPRFDL